MVLDDGREAGETLLAVGKRANLDLGSPYVN